MQISMRDIAQIWRKMFGPGWTIIQFSVVIYKCFVWWMLVIDQSEWSIPESRVIVCGWLYIITYIMLLWLISNNSRAFAQPESVKLAYSCVTMLHLHLISSVSCPAGLKCCSFLHPFGSSCLFSSPVHYVSPRLFPLRCVLLPQEVISSFSSSILHISVRSEWFLPFPPLTHYHCPSRSVSHYLGQFSCDESPPVTSMHLLLFMSLPRHCLASTHTLPLSPSFREETCPSAVRNPAVHSHVMPNPYAVLFSYHFFHFFSFLLIIVFCCI